MSDVSIDPVGHVYFTQTLNNTVEKDTPDGQDSLILAQMGWETGSLVTPPALQWMAQTMSLCLMPIITASKSLTAMAITSHNGENRAKVKSSSEDRQASTLICWETCM